MSWTPATTASRAGRSAIRPSLRSPAEKKRVTTLAAIMIRGAATRSAGSPVIKTVKVTVNKRVYKATGTTSWKVRVALRKGKNTITVIATDASGAKSDPATLIVTRRAE